MAVVRVHRPNLTEEQREYQMEQIKKATIEYCKNVFKAKDSSVLLKKEEEATSITVGDKNIAV